ncbi:hypothetical protein T265_02484 [Opisthorchis viverrini]|uniref:Uncharacterized protein n=1 Tax=Opisthorchis viverrini TaxID=6198 RepID=A0A075A6M6_OPIVI|nr:hypothetical protein T265_02484 [Opisthorchis viverrini]KER31300.1 hypothetical protein T265_02484 [Opisthorchis viverrini]
MILELGNRNHFVTQTSDAGIMDVGRLDDSNEPMLNERDTQYLSWRSSDSRSALVNPFTNVWLFGCNSPISRSSLAQCWLPVSISTERFELEIIDAPRHVQRMTHAQGHHPYDTFRIADALAELTKLGLAT